MELYCTYIETNKFCEVVEFYEKVFQIKGNIYTENRWIEFNYDNKLAIYNREYDIEKINENNINNNFNKAYIKNFKEIKGKNINNIITLNFYTEDLNKEYERIKNLNICDVSEIMYVNISEPYYYFNICDPEGNTIEISGKYKI